jgi:hypothetical protein
MPQNRQHKLSLIRRRSAGKPTLPGELVDASSRKWRADAGHCELNRPQPVYTNPESTKTGLSRVRKSADTTGLGLTEFIRIRRPARASAVTSQ